MVVGSGGAPVHPDAPEIREQITRLGRADIMVGIPSFKNAATIGYVVRAAHAGWCSTSRTWRPVLVNSDAVVRRHPARRHRDRAARYVESILLVRPTNRLDRVTITYPESRASGARARHCADLRDRGRAGRAGAGGGGLRPAEHRAGVDRAARRADPQGRLRLRGPAVLAVQVRRDDHQHRHLPADPGPVRPPDPAADRRRLRRSATLSATTSSWTTGPRTSASSASTSG